MLNYDNTSKLRLTHEYSLNTNTLPPLFRFNSNLDVRYLNNYYQQNISDAAFMFDIFLNCTVQKFYEFTASAFAKDYRKVYCLAHQMIPTFKLVGLTNIASQLKKLGSKVKSFCIDSTVQLISTNFKKAIPIIFIQKAELDLFIKQKNISPC